MALGKKPLLALHVGGLLVLVPLLYLGGVFEGTLGQATIIAPNGATGQLASVETAVGKVAQSTAGATEAPHECPPPGERNPTCTRIQRQTWQSSWDSLTVDDQAAWDDLHCNCRLRVRPSAESPAGGHPGCPSSGRPSGWQNADRKKVRSLKDKYKGERCVLIANGPSLNKIRWDWQDKFKVVMGMNKIFLGLERYNISTVSLKAFAVANKLVMEQSREAILTQVRTFLSVHATCLCCGVVSLG